MLSLLLVMLGGAVGAGARYLTGQAMMRVAGGDYPWGTLTVNLVGGLLMGVLAVLFAKAALAQEPWRLLLAVGVLGGFTTFSSFSLEIVTMIDRGAWAIAIGYAAASIIGSVLALVAGMALARGLA